MKAFYRLCAVVLMFAGAASAQVGTNTAVLNADLATEKELAALPHMTQTLASAVIAKRPFADATALDSTLGALTPAQRQEIYVKLFQPINLNTASEAEMLLIPGMNKRMAHEFEEYRPYTSLAQFRKEIGKYADAKEVARLEQYAFIPMSLNTASEADFASIPGMNKRMVHEFMEYRPYTSIEQFRKEIGKYVDAKEVARLERYVTLK